jgi:hypothetical protein
MRFGSFAGLLCLAEPGNLAFERRIPDSAFSRAAWSSAASSISSALTA